MRKNMENYKMSDEIKTGHSALGLLMAECEQLRRDLKAEEERHKKACDDWLAERRRADKLQGELAQAKAENQTLRNAQKACEDCDALTISEFNRLKAENNELKTRLSKYEQEN